MVLASGFRRANLSFARPYCGRMLHGACQRMHAQWHTFCRRLDAPPPAGASLRRVGLRGRRHPVRVRRGSLRPLSVHAPGGRSLVERPRTDHRFPLANRRSAPSRRHPVRAARTGTATRPSTFLARCLRGVWPPAGDGAGSCAQYSVRGQAAFADGDRPIRAVHPTYGTLPGEPVSAARAVDHAVDGFVLPHGERLRLREPEG